MKTKLLNLILTTAALTMLSPITIFAGTWVSTENTWKYQNDDNSYLSNIWFEENGTYYYFDADGNMLTNTLSPDGYVLGRGGNMLSYTDPLPAIFTGTSTDLDHYTDSIIAFIKEYHEPFFDKYFSASFDTFDVLSLEDYNTTKDLLNQLETYDFTEAMNSSHESIRKLGYADEILRIELIYYLRQLIAAIDAQDEIAFTSALYKIHSSLSTNSNEYFYMIVQIDYYFDQFK